MTSVLVYSSAPIATAGISGFISEMPDMLLDGSYSDFEQLEAHLGNNAPQILFMELTEYLSFPVLARLTASAPATAIILWGVSAPPEFLSQAVKLGIRGILARTSPLEAHIECLRHVAEGRLWIDSGISKRLLFMEKIHLTPRERQIMGLLAQGITNKEIAWSLGIVEGTVKVYLTRLFTKLGVHDRLEVALLALKNATATGELREKMKTAPDGRPIPYNVPGVLVKEHPVPQSGH